MGKEVSRIDEKKVKIKVGSYMGVYKCESETCHFPHIVIYDAKCRPVIACVVPADVLKTLKTWEETEGIKKQ